MGYLFPMAKRESTVEQLTEQAVNQVYIPHKTDYCPVGWPNRLIWAPLDAPT